MRINSIDYIKIQKYIILSFFKKKLWNNIILNLFKLIFATHNLSGLGLRASPVGDANGEANAKTCIFNFSFFIKSFQRSRQQRSQNGFLIWEEVFLQVPVE